MIRRELIQKFLTGGGSPKKPASRKKNPEEKSKKPTNKKLDSEKPKEGSKRNKNTERAKNVGKTEGSSNNKNSSNIQLNPSDSLNSPEKHAAKVKATKAEEKKAPAKKTPAKKAEPKPKEKQSEKSPEEIQVTEPEWKIGQKVTLQHPKLGNNPINVEIVGKDDEHIMFKNLDNPTDTNVYNTTKFEFDVYSNKQNAPENFQHDTELSPIFGFERIIPEYTDRSGNVIKPGTPLNNGQYIVTQISETPGGKVVTLWDPLKNTTSNQEGVSSSQFEDVPEHHIKNGKYLKPKNNYESLEELANDYFHPIVDSFNDAIYTKPKGLPFESISYADTNNPFYDEVYRRYIPQKGEIYTGEKVIGYQKGYETGNPLIVTQNIDGKFNIREFDGNEYPGLDWLINDYSLTPDYTMEWETTTPRLIGRDKVQYHQKTFNAGDKLYMKFSKNEPGHEMIVLGTNEDGKLILFDNYTTDVVSLTGEWVDRLENMIKKDLNESYTYDGTELKKAVDEYKERTDESQQNVDEFKKEWIADNRWLSLEIDANFDVPDYITKRQWDEKMRSEENRSEETDTTNDQPETETNISDEGNHTPAPSSNNTYSSLGDLINANPNIQFDQRNKSSIGAFGGKRKVGQQVFIGDKQATIVAVAQDSRNNQKLVVKHSDGTYELVDKKDSEVNNPSLTEIASNAPSVVESLSEGVITVPVKGLVGLGKGALTTGKVLTGIGHEKSYLPFIGGNVRKDFKDVPVLGNKTVGNIRTIFPGLRGTVGIPLTLSGLGLVMQNGVYPVLQNVDGDTILEKMWNATKSGFSNIVTDHNQYSPDDKTNSDSTAVDSISTTPSISVDTGSVYRDEIDNLNKYSKIDVQIENDDSDQFNETNTNQESSLDIDFNSENFKKGGTNIY